MTILAATFRALAGALALAALAPSALAEEPPLPAGQRCPELADGAAAAEARAAERYRLGQELYTKGDYELAIPEFVATYCLVPVPEAVYNIAQSYERLVDFEQAVAWFELYLRVLPGDKTEELERVAHRVTVLRRLPARVRVATDPPGADIALAGASGAAVRGKSNDPEPMRVPAGVHVMQIELPGYVPVTQEVTLQIGQPYTYSYRLTPKTGKLRVAVYPRGASVFVDNKIVGVGGFVDRLPVGPHAVRVEAEGRPTEQHEVALAQDATVTLNVRMGPPRPRNGRVELLIAATMTGLVDGLVIGTSAGLDQKTTGAVMLAGAGAGFAAPFLLLPRYLPAGHTSLAVGSAGWGAVETVGAAMTLSLDNSWTGPLAVGASAAFAGASMLYTSRHPVSEGDAALLNSGAIWGTITSLLVWGTFQDVELVGPVILAGLNLGLASGGLLARRYEPSRGHVALVDLSAATGLVSGFALAQVLRADDARSQARTSLGGLGIGLVAGALLTRGIEDDAVVVPSLGVAAGPEGAPVVTYGMATRW